MAIIRRAGVINRMPKHRIQLLQSMPRDVPDRVPAKMRSEMSTRVSAGLRDQMLRPQAGVLFNAEIAMLPETGGNHCHQKVLHL
jgi:hypothetical protein